jgi:protein disulfide-isomerase A1
MLRQILPLVSTVASDNLEELRSIDLPLVIAFVDEDDQTSREMFALIAEDHRDQFLFGISSNTSLSGIKSEFLKQPFVVLHSSLDHIDRVFSEPFETDKIQKFLNQVSTPLVGKFSMETYYTYTQVVSHHIHIYTLVSNRKRLS